MSRTVRVPDFGAVDSLYQPVEVPEPGDPGYPARPLPEGDPWAKYVNPVIEAAGECAGYQAWNEPEAGT
jgi:hypothetical protein